MLQEGNGILEVAYELSLVASMGIFGSVAGILHSGKKHSLGSVFANMFIACFISIVIKLFMYDFNNDFILLAVIGALCFNSKYAINVILKIPAIFFKSENIKKVIDIFIAEAGSINDNNSDGDGGNASDKNCNNSDESSKSDTSEDKKNNVNVSEKCVEKKAENIDNKEKQLVLKKKSRYVETSKPHRRAKKL